MKKLFLALLTYLSLINIHGQPAVSNGVFDRVVIDAGHGGYDSGARGSVAKEKDITLAIALETGRLIRERLTGVEVIYTRDKDVFVPLHRRAQIANQAAADLFISIHCNSNTSTRPFGAETYVMGLHKSPENLEVAKTENMAILMEENYDENYDGFNPESDEDYILLNMFQHNSLDQSIEFSAMVQQRLKSDAGLFDRGVKQAGFVVLYLTTMPGALIETGFLSNPAEEQFLIDPLNQKMISDAIFYAVKEYKDYSDALFEKTQLAQNNASKFASEAGSVIYKIAFLQTKDLLPFDAPQLSGLEQIMAFKSNGFYIYAFGSADSAEAAEQMLNKKGRIKGLGKKLKNATIIKFENYQ